MKSDIKDGAKRVPMSALRGLAAAVCLLAVMTGKVNAQAFGDGDWQAQGPGPILFGQTEGVTPDNEVVGAVHTVLAHPTNPDMLYIGAVNGGIWKTVNATAVSPNWTRLTDDFPSLSIGAMAFDSADATLQTVYAGIGRYSSLGSFGGDRIGLLKSTDGGTTWTVIDAGGALAGKNISGLAVNGSDIVASVNLADSFTFSNIGIFRSSDGGATFARISDGDGTATGLPGGVAHDLVRDPSNASRLFTSLIFAEGAGGTSGFYRSNDFGATWSKVSDAAIDALFFENGDNAISNIEFAVGQSSNVYAAIVRFGRLAGVFRSGDAGSTWTAMDLPTTIEDGFGIGVHPGGQGGIHLSIAADPINANIVYIGGDRQPRFNEASGNPVAGFPNSIGAQNFSGRLFRGNASQPTGSQWTPLTHSGTASNSSPHADSREMTFDANGALIETDDGGIYRRTQPRSPSGDWVSINGDLQSTEYHGIAYDAVSDIVIGGSQDVGTSQQIMIDDPVFETLFQGDGGDPGVDDISSPNQSTRFFSFQFLGNFARAVFDDTNTLQSFVVTDRTVLSGGAAISPQFYTPIIVNSQQGNRLLIGAGNSLYESLDQADTVTEIAEGWRANAFVGDPLVYGVPGNPDLIVLAATEETNAQTGARQQRILIRTGGPGAAFTEVIPPSSGTIIDLAVDPDQAARIIAMTAVGVFLSSDSGANWSTVTGNLQSFDPGTLRSLAFVPGTDDAVVVGSNRGTFFATASGGFDSWSEFGQNLPNAPVFELEYDAADNVLVAGLLGRGAWKFTSVSDFDPDVIFADGFESPAQP